ncbi:MFS transporter [Pseudonocardia sp. Cha107L01]|uniref:MFS transporter n=1 Tax=Pseudonocardia sp. Cha107L01 TaxID=3457576 RepID=UPI00403EA9E3
MSARSRPYTSSVRVTGPPSRSRVYDHREHFRKYIDLSNDGRSRYCRSVPDLVLGLAAVPIMTELAPSNSEYGLASSSFYVLFNDSAVLVGLLANRVRSRWVFVVLAALCALAQVPVLLSATLGALFVSRILMGAAEGPANPLTVHTAHSWFPPKDRSLPTALTQALAEISRRRVLATIAEQRGA